MKSKTRVLKYKHNKFRKILKLLVRVGRPIMEIIKKSYLYVYFGLKDKL